MYKEEKLMKILITGAYGFLGKNLIAKLKESGEKYEIYSFEEFLKGR